MPTERLTLLAVAGAAVLALVGGLYFGRGPEPAPPVLETGVPESDPNVVIHVSGAVTRAGLVSLPASARVADAIAAAGGATADADLAAVNLAGPVRDGDQIVVPAVGDDPGTPEGIDLNRSTPEQLAELPGIGPVLAERIAAFREEHGPYEAVEDLLDVPGIGEAKLAMLRADVTKP